MQRQWDRNTDEELGIEWRQRPPQSWELVVARQQSRKSLDPQGRCAWASGKSLGEGGDRYRSKGGTGSEGMFWLDSLPNNDWDWNIDVVTSLAILSLEASPLTYSGNLPDPPGLLLKIRFQEMESDSDSEDDEVTETACRKQYPKVVGPRYIDTRRKRFTFTRGANLPTSHINPSVRTLIVEPDELDIHCMVSGRWCRTDTNRGWRKIRQSIRFMCSASAYTRSGDS